MLEKIKDKKVFIPVLAVIAVIVFFSVAPGANWRNDFVQNVTTSSEVKDFVSSIQDKLGQYFDDNGSYPNQISELNLTSNEAEQFNEKRGEDNPYYVYSPEDWRENICAYEITQETTFEDSFGLTTGDVLYKQSADRC